MIDPMLANSFIKRVAQCTEYNINIMDERGIIIASRNPARVGTFHEVAMKIMKGTQDVIIVNEENSGYGVKKGVNMAIYSKNHKEGVLGITGDPEEVGQIAQIVKLSVEVMLEHELLKLEKIQRRSLKEQLLNNIINSDEIHMDDLKRYTQPLKLKENVLRIPVLIHIKEQKSAKICEEVMDLLRNSQSHSSQDLSSMVSEREVLLYKYLEDTADIMQQYKYVVAEALSMVLRYLRNSGYQYSIYVGSFKNDFRSYKTGYRQCQWLGQQIGEEGSYYFYDHSSDYFMAHVPVKEFEDAFGGIESIMTEKQIENFKEVIGALQKAYYNLSVAGELMHVHKNTLSYRLDKIRELLHMDPLGNNKDRDFCNYFYYYLNIKK